MKTIWKTAFVPFIALASASALSLPAGARGENAVPQTPPDAAEAPAADAGGKASGGDAASAGEDATPVESHRAVFDELIPLQSSPLVPLQATVCLHGIKPDGQDVVPEPPIHRCESLTGESAQLASPVSPSPEGFHVTVELPRLSDVRVRLLDESRKLLPASDSMSSTAAVTLVDIVPAAPLVSGTAYKIRIDGFIGEFPTAPDGVAYGTMTVSFKTDGQKPAPPPKEKQGKSRKKSRSRKR